VSLVAADGADAPDAEGAGAAGKGAAGAEALAGADGAEGADVSVGASGLLQPIVVKRRRASNRVSVIGWTLANHGAAVSGIRTGPSHILRCSIRSLWCRRNR